MEITETQNEGLSRRLKVTVPASELDAKLTTKLEGMKGQIRLKGFRPGKVPVSFLKKTYGKSLMAEIIEETVAESSQKALADKELRAAQQPKIDLQGEIEQVASGTADLEYEMAVEVIPDFEPGDPAELEVTRPVAEVTDDAVDEALKNLAGQQKSYAAREDDAAAEEGDRLTIDFVGRVDGETFEGGAAEGFQLVLGSGQFIEGFEDQLIGVKAGEDREVNVTFPDTYPVDKLKSKPAVFSVSVAEVAAPQDPEMNDAFAKGLGVDSFDKLKDMIRDRLKDEYAQYSRSHLKRDILDKLDDRHSFELPLGMVEAEFDGIWKQVTEDIERQGKSLEDEDVDAEALKSEYRQIAERRVRLGLVLAEIGRRNNITVTGEELNRALQSRARQFPGQEKQVFDFYQKNPQALDSLRAPIFEEKVVDYIIELAKVTEKPVTAEELMKDPDEEELATAVDSAAGQAAATAEGDAASS